MDLCKYCEKLDFESLRLRKDVCSLGFSISSLVPRSRKCRFCKFLVTLWSPENLMDDPLPEKLRIDSHQRGSCPIPDDGSGVRSDVNSLRVMYSNFPTVHMDFCILPTPTVREYVNSRSLYLDGVGRRFSRRSVEPMVDLGLAVKWLQLCKEKHGEACEHPSWLDIDEFPTNLRVIDVTTMSLATAPRFCRYITLSYVWGKPGNLHAFHTSKSTIEAYTQKGGLSLEKVPKTIADSIRLVQEVGERYLWIDSLCIIQDDQFDKHFQMKQMDLIYACSIFTVVAAVGEDCNAGLPGLFHGPRIPSQLLFEINPDSGLIGGRREAFNHSKWSTRGWTYQELQLSRRALIFHEDTISWNCECDYWEEDMCLEPVAPDSAPCIDNMGISLGFRTSVPRFDLYSLGNHIFRYNADRDFTNEEDAFDAFRGILNRINRVTGKEFYWGLICEHFHAALLWRDDHSLGWRQDRRRLSPCEMINADGTKHSIRIPSWSWLGWYTRWHQLFYPGQRLVDLGRFYEPRNTDWAAKWFRIDLNGLLSEMNSQHQEFKSSALSSNPSWVGAPIASNVAQAGVRKDYGRIVTQTSFNTLRIKTQLLDISSRKIGRAPRDDKFFDLLDKSNSKRIGELYATDSLCIAEKWDNAEELLELESCGVVRDFIVISRERWTADVDEPYNLGLNRVKKIVGDEDKYKLNLMLIKWNLDEPSVASRVSLFQINERLWIESKPQWRRVILE